MHWLWDMRLSSVHVPGRGSKREEGVMADVNNSHESEKNSSSSALETHFVSLTSFGLGSRVGSRVRKRM
jgi:hypothetical protein